MTTSLRARVLFCLALLAALGWLTASAQALVVIGGSDQLPNPAERYVSGAPVGFLDTGTGGIIIIGGFEWMPLDGLGLQGPQPHLGGGWEVDSFFDITYHIDFLGGPDTKTGMGRGHMMGMGIGDPNLRSFDTEMLMLDLSGSGFRLRESPTKASTGQSMIQELSGGRFGIDSFFDVFTELSLDDGQTWLPADGAMHMTTIPEPSSFVLLGAGVLVLGFLARRRDED